MAFLKALIIISLSICFFGEPLDFYLELGRLSGFPSDPFGLSRRLGGDDTCPAVPVMPLAQGDLILEANYREFGTLTTLSIVSLVCPNAEIRP